MLRALQGQHADTRAGELSLALGLERLDAVATLPIELDERSGRRPRLELRVLGASHQVVLTDDLTGDATDDSSGPETTISETVACLPGRSAELPSTVVEQLGGWRYTFTARVHRYGPTQFDAHVERLLQGIDSQPAALACSFPESPYAVTVVVATTRDQPLGWRTWHTYPQDGDIVETRTEVLPL